MENTAQELLSEGRPRDALDALKDQARAHPGDPECRFALFGLFALLGDLDRAKNQIEVAANLDAKLAPLAAVYLGALEAERERQRVFAGTGQPVLVGEPEPWTAALVEALRLEVDGHADRARDLRAEALADAAPVAGTCDGRDFPWLMDGDCRLGPVLEAVVRGAYRWIPYGRLRRVEVAPPTSTVDLVWGQAEITWANGGQTLALVPVRYPETHTASDEALIMARKTDWREVAEQSFHGLGQRELLGPDQDFPWLDVRSLEFRPADEPAASPDPAP